MADAPAGFKRVAGYERFTGENSAPYPGVPGDGPIQELGHWNNRVMVKRDDRWYSFTGLKWIHIGDPSV